MIGLGNAKRQVRLTHDLALFALLPQALAHGRGNVKDAIPRHGGFKRFTKNAKLVKEIAYIYAIPKVSI